jgi:hypothetical protein
MSMRGYLGTYLNAKFVLRHSSLSRQDAVKLGFLADTSRLFTERRCLRSRRHPSTPCLLLSQLTVDDVPNGTSFNIETLKDGVLHLDWNGTFYRKGGARRKFIAALGGTAALCRYRCARSATYPKCRHSSAIRCRSNLPFINHSGAISQCMDTDAAQPRCPFCGTPMQFKPSVPSFGAHSALQTFDCRGCQVILTIPPGAEVFEMAGHQG